MRLSTSSSTGGVAGGGQEHGRPPQKLTRPQARHVGMRFEYYEVGLEVTLLASASRLQHEATSFFLQPTVLYDGGSISRERLAFFGTGHKQVTGPAT